VTSETAVRPPGASTAGAAAGATAGPGAPQALLLAPSRGLGGGIERYVETVEAAFADQAVTCARLDLARPGLRALAAPALLILLTCLTIVPWTIRNAVELHSFVPISDETGITLAGTYNPRSANDPQLSYKWHLFSHVPELRHYARRSNDETEPQLSSQLTAAALGAYAFSQLRFRGKNLVFMAYVALLLVPWTLTLIPLFLTIQKLHFFNTWWALILPYAASAQPLLVLIFRGFFEQIPRELVEGARVDGCAERQVLTRIVVPLTRPVLLTGAILVMINVWGDYLWPTIVIQDPSKITISPGVQQFVGSFGLNASSGGAVFAAFVIATVPMFVLVGCAMRYFVSGLTEGALKL